ncbi:hypothetical protein [Streptomyces sp. SID13031]|uniref:hypothetical protein n=1 Tax=Streptomyces sp. SID13031 TaxID=2706046 RepID=UPI0013CBF021|nr:hypothetical protein [Streptomyces sp. SID13031]NEA36182.1 hypothetical protein [Streptomyces sp. SID13031]
MLTRATAISAALAVLATGGLATAAVARSHSSADGGGAWNVVAGGDLKGPPAAKKPVGTQPKPVDKVPALKAAQVRYQHESWGDPKTEVGVVIWAPKGWKKVKLSTFEVKFTSPNGRWNLRVDATAKDEPIKTAADAKYELTSSSTEDFKLISRETGATRATNPNFQGVIFHHRTLTYTYTDPNRGPRLVVDRFVSIDDTAHTMFEVSTGGRPQDAAALAAITAKATEDFIRLP